nr:hypothetical protein [Clostridium perfringens]
MISLLTKAEGSEGFSSGFSVSPGLFGVSGFSESPGLSGLTGLSVLPGLSGLSGLFGLSGFTGLSGSTGLLQVVNPHFHLIPLQQPRIF